LLQALAPTLTSTDTLPRGPVLALAHIDGCEGLRLRDLDQSLARHFQRRTERAGNRRAGDVGTAQVLLEILRQGHPLSRPLPDQRLEALPRILDGPHRAPGNDVHALGGAPALLGVGL